MDSQSGGGVVVLLEPLLLEALNPDPLAFKPEPEAGVIDNEAAMEGISLEGVGVREIGGENSPSPARLEPAPGNETNHDVGSP